MLPDYTESEIRRTLEVAEIHTVIRPKLTSRQSQRGDEKYYVFRTLHRILH